MDVKHVLIGGFFTLVGVVTLLVPAIPFICIGALILGPLELIVGLMAGGKPSEVRLPSVESVAPIQLAAVGDATGPFVRVAARRELARVYVVVAVNGLAQHEIVAGYEGETATVLVDDYVYRTFRRPLGGTAGTDVDIVLPEYPNHRFAARFWGWRAHITVLCNGMEIAGV